VGHAAGCKRRLAGKSPGVASFVNSNARPKSLPSFNHQSQRRYTSQSTGFV
jgi:hypothetical protein